MANKRHRVLGDIQAKDHKGEAVRLELFETGLHHFYLDATGYGLTDALPEDVRLRIRYKLDLSSATTTLRMLTKVVNSQFPAEAVLEYVREACSGFKYNAPIR